MFMPIPNCTSDKDVDILAADILNRGSGTVGSITWVNPPKPYPQSRALYVTVYKFSIA